MSIRNSIFMTLLAAALLTACDNIPVSDRTTPLDASSFKKPVVVVDFTGVDCTNCPKAAKGLSSMHSIVGDKIIGIAMYPDCSFNHHATFDLKCPEATEYYKAFGDLSKIVLPSGMVDFVQYKTQYIFDYTLWNSAVLERITQDTPIEVSLTVTKETKGDTTNLNITSKVTAQSAVSGSTALILWLVEDGIVGYQNDGGTPRNDYVHNHGLRTAINGLWGESISLSTAGTVDKTLSYEVKNDKWNLENCSVVGVVINTNTKEIITAGTAKVQ